MTHQATSALAKERHDVTLEGRRATLREALAELIPKNGEIVWEVGCGHGHFLTEYAAANPATVCIGVDIMGDRIGRAGKKQERARLKNLSFLRAEAYDFLEALPAAARFRAVIVLFPDPWPKARHHKHRLMQSRFLEAIRPRMAAGGRLYFRTDYAPYFQEVREVLLASPGWDLVDESWPFEPKTVFQARAPSHQSLVAGVG